MIEVTEIFMWHERAYLPVLGKTEVGFFWEAGTLLTAELSVDALEAALERIVELGNPSMRHPTQAEFQKLTPVQKALGMRGWKKMARAGVVRCGIWWIGGRILVAFSPRDAKDIQETDFANQKEFPIDASLRMIAEHILREVSVRQLSGTANQEGN